MTNKLSLIIPALNESPNIDPLYRSILEHVDRLGVPFEVILVDDGSTDDTFDVMARLARFDPRVTAVRLRRNFGQTAALAAGLEHASGDIIVTLDADLQNDPADIPMMLDVLRGGYDMVLGYRERRQDPFWTRRLPSQIANRLISRVTGIKVRDTGCALKVIRGDVLRRIPLYSDMHRFVLPMALPIGVRVREVPVRHHPRRQGQSKYGLGRIQRVVVDLVVIRLLLRFARRPFGIFFGPAIIAALIATVLGVLSVGPSSGSGSRVFADCAFLLGALAVFLVSLGLSVGLIGRRQVQ